VHREPIATPPLSGGTVGVRFLDWEQECAESMRAFAADLLLGADVTYDPAFCTPLTNTIRAACTDREVSPDHALVSFFADLLAEIDAGAAQPVEQRIEVGFDRVTVIPLLSVDELTADLHARTPTSRLACTRGALIAVTTRTVRTYVVFLLECARHGLRVRRLDLGHVRRRQLGTFYHLEQQQVFYLTTH
jgi:Lysine methyltransferase